MSTDFSVLCDTHRLYRHLGQTMGGRNTFGYGSKDAEGRTAVASFIFNHLGCNIRIVGTDYVPENYENDRSDKEHQQWLANIDNEPPPCPTCGLVRREEGVIPVDYHH